MKFAPPRGRETKHLGISKSSFTLVRLQADYQLADDDNNDDGDDDDDDVDYDDDNCDDDDDDDDDID